MTHQHTQDVLAQIDDAIDDWEVGPDAVRFNAPTAARPAARAYTPPDVAGVTAALGPVLRAMDRAARHLDNVVFAPGGALQSLKAYAAALAPPPSPYDAHHPRPLQVDGHAYRRRTRARRRRRGAHR